jgi:hypothetical protein
MTYLRWYDGQVLFKVGIQNVRQDSALCRYVYLHGKTCWGSIIILYLSLTFIHTNFKGRKLKGVAEE